MLKSQVEQMTERLYELHGILKIEEGELNEYVNINSALLSVFLLLYIYIYLIFRNTLKRGYYIH